MVEESAKEEWVRVLTERPPDRDEEESRYVQAVSETGFMLLELAAAEDADLSLGDRLAVESTAFNRVTRRLTYHTLTHDAQDRLKETIAAIIGEQRTAVHRLVQQCSASRPSQHQLDVLPEIGDKRREAIIDERRRDPFAGFTDLEARVDSLSEPQALLVDRALTELKEVEEARYKLLVT